MKKSILTLSAALILFSCSDSKEDNQPSRDEIFNKSVKFLDSKLNTDPEKGTFTFLEIDTINVISSKGIETVKKMPLMKELKYHLKYFEEFGEIDKQFNSEEGDQTRFHREKALELRDSLQSWNMRTAKLDSTDTVGFEVMIATEAVNNESGAKMKDLSFPVYLDDEYDVSLPWNNNKYGNPKK